MPSEVRRSRQRRLLAALRALRSSSEAEARALRASLQATRLLLDASEQERVSRVDALRSQVRELIRSHRAEIESYEGAIRRLNQEIHDLLRKVGYLSTSSGAMRVLLGVGLQTVGLYEMLRRRRRTLERMVPLDAPPSDASTTATPPRPAGDSPAEPRPSLLDAFLFARSLEGDTTELALERLYQLGSRLKNVLCVHASARSAQAAYILASGGADVTVLGSTDILDRLPIPGLTVASEGFGDWLMSRAGVLDGIDGVLLDPEMTDEEERLLRGRLAPQCTLVMNGPVAKLPLDASVVDQVDGLSVLCPPPAALRDPRCLAALPSGRPWPRISVVTATLNQGDFLEETIRSVLGQEYPDLEYIVIDGGSTDGTTDILTRYRDRLARCVSGPDEGQGDALNKGFALATGSLLAWLNSDDRYPAGALWRAALAFDTYGADMVAGGCALVRDRADEVLRVHHSTLPVGRVVSLPRARLLDIDGSWTRGDFFYQPEVFWTRELWEAAGGRVAKDLYYSMDYELWVRMAGCGARVVHVPDTLAVYRMHKAQKTDGAELPYLPELKQVAARYRSAPAG